MYDCPYRHTLFAHKFTGKERDSESNLDYFEARHYTSSMGHFMSPDPAGLTAANALFPQNWNLYSYVQDNPLSRTDPTGLWCVWEDGTHDPDASDGGWDKTGCLNQGGHWDSSDTITGLLTDKNGNITFFRTNSGWIDGVGNVNSLDQYLFKRDHPVSMGPAAKDCSFFGRMAQSVDVSAKLGFGLELGPADVEATAGLNWTPDTNQLKAVSGAQTPFAGFGAEKSLSPPKSRTRQCQP